VKVISKSPKSTPTIIQRYKGRKTRVMSFIPKLLIWAFCSTLLALRVDARRKPENAHLPSNGGSQ
jgi:hypothetical protein